VDPVDRQGNGENEPEMASHQTIASSATLIVNLMLYVIPR
jgi:hypothetical protein